MKGCSECEAWLALPVVAQFQRSATKGKKDSTPDQWERTVRWTSAITACFCVIYASAVAIQLLVRAPDWAEALSDMPPEMLSSFLRMLVLGPILFSIPVFVISLVVVRVVFAFVGRWNPPFADACVKT